MKRFAHAVALAACLLAPSAVSAQSSATVDLTDAQMEELVRRSYQYVAMYNVNNGFGQRIHDTECHAFAGLDVDRPVLTGCIGVYLEAVAVRGNG